MPGRPFVLIAHDTQARRIGRVARKVLGDEANIQIAHDGEEGRAALERVPAHVASIVIVDLSLPEKKHRTPASNDVGRRLAQQAAEDADSRALKRLIIQYTVTHTTQCASGTDNVPVRHFAAGETELLEKVKQWLADDTACDDLPRGEWTAEASHFLSEVHAHRHDVITPFLAIDMDLQTLAGLLERSLGKAHMSAEDERLFTEVTQALKRNAAEEPQSALRAADEFGGIRDPDNWSFLQHIERDDDAKAAWQEANHRLSSLKDGCERIAGATDWEEVAGQAGDFQRDLIGLRDALETVVQYFERRFGKQAGSAG